MSGSLWPHGLKHARLPCPSPPSEAYWNACPLSLWGPPTISSSVILFSSCLQSFPASRFFPRSQFFASGGQRSAALASASVLPLNIQDWFPLGIDWFDLLAVQGTLKSLLQYHNKKASVEKYTTIANKLFKEFLCMWVTTTCFEAGKGADKYL